MMISLAVAVFVLDMSSYTTIEGQGSQTVFAVLQSGVLAQDVVVTVQTVPNPQATAFGNSIFCILTV